MTLAVAGAEGPGDSFPVPVGARVDRAVALPPGGASALRVAYAWTDTGHGASDARDVPIGACAGTYRISITIDTATGETWSSSHGECAPV
jgi:hypothetical protein